MFMRVSEDSRIFFAKYLCKSLQLSTLLVYLFYNQNKKQ